MRFDRQHPEATGSPEEHKKTRLLCFCTQSMRMCGAGENGRQPCSVIIFYVLLAAIASGAFLLTGSRTTVTMLTIRGRRIWICDILSRRTWNLFELRTPRAARASISLGQIESISTFKSSPKANLVYHCITLNCKKKLLKWLRHHVW